MKPSDLLTMGLTVLLALAATVLILLDLPEARAQQGALGADAAQAWIGCGA